MPSALKPKRGELRVIAQESCGCGCGTGCGCGCGCCVDQARADETASKR